MPPLLYCHFTIKEFNKRLKPNGGSGGSGGNFTIKEFNKRLKHPSLISLCHNYFTIKEFNKRLKLLTSSKLP